MAEKSQQHCAFRATGLLALSIPLFLLTEVRAGGKLAESLKWTIAASKAVYYPGEPVALTITIPNAGSRDESVYLGVYGIGAFSFDLCDNSGRILAQGGRVKGEGDIASSRSVFLKVPAGRTAQTPVVLNRWCSTLLPPGEYRVICHADYELQSEATPIPGSTKGFRLDAPHKAEMSLDVNIVKADPPKYKDILDDLAKDADRERQPGETLWGHRTSQESAAEMIAFCEWPEATPYQLRALRSAAAVISSSERPEGLPLALPAVRMRIDPWVTLCLIRNLGKSKNLEAANGLMPLADNGAFRNFRFEIVTAVHSLHASGEVDVVKATDAFVEQNPL
jgi:hypothetical protein